MNIKMLKVFRERAERLGVPFYGRDYTRAWIRDRLREHRATKRWMVSEQRRQMEQPYWDRELLMAEKQAMQFKK